MYPGLQVVTKHLSTADDYAQAYRDKLWADGGLATIEDAIPILYVQLVQLSNAAESLKDNSLPLGPAGGLSLEQLKAELVRTNVILQTEELRG